MQSLGEMLIEARKSVGLSAGDIADRTHIMQAAIINLEEDNLESMPAAGYVRGYILSYCKICAVDPAPYLEQYEIQTGSNRRDSITRNSYGYEQGPTTRNQQNHDMNWKVILVVVIVIAAIAGAIFYFTRSTDDFAPGTSPLPAEVATPTVSTDPEDLVPEADRVPFSFSIEARPDRASNVRIVVDGSVVFDGSLTPENDESFAGITLAEIEIGSPENVILMQGEEAISIPEDGVVTLTAPAPE